MAKTPNIPLLDSEPEDIMRTRKEHIMDAVLKILDALDLSPEMEEGLVETPRRVAEHLMEFRQNHDYISVMGKPFDSKGHHNMIAQSNIPFRMLCEHHLVPAIGRAAIGYIPNKSVVGLSKLTRLIQAVGTERPSLQEYVCDKVADLLFAHIDPKGVIVAIKAEHGCMACRGVNSPGVMTMTSSVRGVFRDVPAARDEFFQLTRM